MATEITHTCDVCDRDAEIASLFPWPMTVSDSGGASKDVCSERCLLDLAVCLIEDEAREVGRTMTPWPSATRKRWWQR